MSAHEIDLSLLTDDLEHDVPLDLLDHQSLADAVASAIRATPNRRTLGIALYASWGQGKSTVGELIKEALRPELVSKRYAFVRIETWKYALENDRQPLRRHYLLRAYEATHMIEKADELRETFTHVYTKRRPRLFHTAGGYRRPWFSRRVLLRLLARCRRRRLRLRAWTQRSLVPPLLVLVAIIVLVLPPLRDATLSAGGVMVALALALAGGLALTALSAIASLSRLVAAGLTVESSVDPFRSVEEFDRQFMHFLNVDAASYERFIFFIDDLDRCHDGIVAEALETLQAFFDKPRCVFIVAADQKQLKRAVREKSIGPATSNLDGRSIPPDEHFLEKIFNVSLHLPPLFQENLLAYAKQLGLRGTPADLSEHLQDEILSYLVHPEVSSPRQVKAILNDYALTYAQIELREAVPETHLNHDPLSSHHLLVARMVVLRAHFPWFYDLLRTDPAILRQWRLALPVGATVATSAAEAALRDAVRAAAVRAARDSTAFALGDADHDVTTVDALLNALRGFLARTRDAEAVDATRIHEFMYLRTPAAYGGLVGEGGLAFRAAIANADLAGLQVAIDAHPTLVRPALDAALSQALTGFGVERDNAREPLARLIAAADGTTLEALGQRVADALFNTDV